MRKTAKVKVPNFFTCIVFFFLSTEFLIGTTLESFLGVSTEIWNQILAYIELTLLMVQLFAFQRYTKKQLIIIGMIAIPVVLSTVLSGSNSLMSFVLFMLASKDTDLDSLVRMMYHLSLVLIPLVIFLCLIGVLEDHTTYRFSIPRYSLGFSHPNTLGQRIFIFFACHCYLRFNKLGWFDGLLVLLAAIFCYAVPNSQTAVILLLLMFFGIVVFRIFKRRHLECIFGKILIILAGVCNMSSIILSLIDVRRYPTLHLFDMLISYRFSSCHEIIQLFGIPVFGQQVLYQSDEALALRGIRVGHTLFLDNAYCSILVTFGIVIFILFSVMYCCNMIVQLKKQRYNLVFILFLIAIYGVMERTLFIITLNIFLVSASDLIYSTKTEREDVALKRKEFGECSKGSEMF